MSIAVKFSMGPRKNWFSGTVWNQDTAEEYAKNLALDLGYPCDAIQGYLIFQFCPEGFLWMTWKEDRIIGECQTNVTGPGFHAAVIHFIELFSSKGKLKLKVNDPTGYYEERDFQKMRREHFYQWFTDLMNETVGSEGDEGMQLLCWPTEYYLPKERPGTIMTHIRPFTRSEVYGMVHSGLSMAFARDFFIWNEEEKDAYYYRNCALVLINQECYFKPSSRSDQDHTVNQEIIRCLEKALELEPGIPFPRAEYLEICALDGRKPMEVSETALIAGGIAIGCRRDLIFRVIGKLRFAVPGSFLYDGEVRGKTEHYFEERGMGKRDYFICAVQTEGTAGFQEDSFKKDTVEEVVTRNIGDAVLKIAVYKPERKDDQDIYVFSGQIIYKNQLTIISIRCTALEDREWAVDLMQEIQTIE